MQPLKSTPSFSSFIVNLTSFPEPTYPKDMKKFALQGLGGSFHKLDPKILKFPDAFRNGIFQIEKGEQMTGHKILSHLAHSYIPGQDFSKAVYEVVSSDPIVNCYGLKALQWVEDHWSQIPKNIILHLQNKVFYGWRDVIRRTSGIMSLPYIDCLEGKTPVVKWRDLDRVFRHNDLALVVNGCIEYEE